MLDLPTSRLAAGGWSGRQCAAFALAFACALLLATARASARPTNASAALPALTNVCTERPPTDSAPSAGGVPAAPLVIGATSRIVVMEYEAWFGPRTGVYPQPGLTTCLQSADMQAGGGGYDSSAAPVIAQHVAWLEQMGFDAVTVDLTNNVSCIYDGDNPAIVRQVCPNPAFRAQNVRIRDNDVHLYPAWTRLGTRLKIIPLLGGFGRYTLTPDKDDPQHRSALQKEADDFGAQVAMFPNSSVMYGGKPLMLIYLGTPVDPARVSAIRTMLQTSNLEQSFTFELIAGYLDSQPEFWTRPHEVPDGPIRIASRYGFWSVVDRLNFWGAPPAPYYPTYNMQGTRVENMTASLATAGQTGWFCNVGGKQTYCPDAALRYCGAGYANGCEPGVYETFGEFMRYAQALQPVVLLIDQFNEFATPDEGPNANTNDDAEPTREWGYSAVRAIIEAVRAYRSTPFAR
jgi:hypothetical protein